MRIFVIADLHLALSVDKPMDLFGKRWENHQERLEQHWRDLVGPEDAVLIPGDISWGLRLDEARADLEFIHSLPGEKILMRGNHDYWWSTVGKLKRTCKEEGWDSLRFLQTNALPVGEKVVVAGSRGWILEDDPKFSEEEDRKILEREKIRLELSLKEAKAFQNEGRRLIVMTHYPPFNKNAKPNEVTSLIRQYNAETAFFGHIHQAHSPYHMSQRVVDGVPYSLIAADYLAFRPSLVLDDTLPAPQRK